MRVSWGEKARNRRNHTQHKLMQHTLMQHTLMQHTLIQHMLVCHCPVTPNVLICLAVGDFLPNHNVSIAPVVCHMRTLFYATCDGVTRERNTVTREDGRDVVRWFHRFTYVCKSCLTNPQIHALLASCFSLKPRPHRCHPSLRTTVTTTI